jgi:hypothetical protein
MIRVGVGSTKTKVPLRNIATHPLFIDISCIIGTTPFSLARAIWLIIERERERERERWQMKNDRTCIDRKLHQRIEQGSCVRTVIVEMMQKHLSSYIRLKYWFHRLLHIDIGWHSLVTHERMFVFQVWLAHHRLFLCVCIYNRQERCLRLFEIINIVNNRWFLFIRNHRSLVDYRHLVEVLMSMQCFNRAFIHMKTNNRSKTTQRWYGWIAPFDDVYFRWLILSFIYSQLFFQRICNESFMNVQKRFLLMVFVGYSLSQVTWYVCLLNAFVNGYRTSDTLDCTCLWHYRHFRFFIVWTIRQPRLTLTWVLSQI